MRVGDDDGARPKTIEQGFGGSHVVVVSRRDQEADRSAFRVDARVNFNREPASIHGKRRVNDAPLDVCQVVTCHDCAACRRPFAPTRACRSQARTGFIISPGSGGHTTSGSCLSIMDRTKRIGTYKKASLKK